MQPRQTHMRRRYGDDLPEIVRCRMRGMHPREIAELHERSKSAIDRILSVEKERRGLEYPPLVRSNTVWTQQKIEEMARGMAGKSYRQLGRENSVNCSRIHYLLAKRAEGLTSGTWIAGLATVLLNCFGYTALPI